MAQAKVTSYYNTRKRIKDDKLFKRNDIPTNFKLSDHDLKSKEDTDLTKLTTLVKGLHDDLKTEVESETIKNFKSVPSQGENKKIPKVAEKNPSNPLDVKAKKTKKKTGKAKVTTNSRSRAIEKIDKSADIRSAFQLQIKSENDKTITATVEHNIPNTEVVERDGIYDDLASTLNTTFTVTDLTPQNPESGQLRTPKRNLSDPKEENIQSKKRKKSEQLVVQDAIETPLSNNPIVATSTVTNSMVQHAARKKLNLESEGESGVKKNIENSDDMGNQEFKGAFTSDEKAKLQNSGRLAELKEKLAKFNQSSLNLKEYKSNKFKITSVIGPVTDKSESQDLKEKQKISVPAYEKFHSLSTPDVPSLTLPYKYKLLSETFRCSDTVVSMLNNRKEVCTFEKLKNGVQDMTKRSFSKTHLGQIKTVFPLAYEINVEKCSTALISRKPGASNQQLVITPNLTSYNKQLEDNVSLTSIAEKNLVHGKQHQENKKVQNKKNNINTQAAFIHMSPSCLVERKHIFGSSLLKIAKKHHQDFLTRLNPPILIPSEKLARWHPRFPLDSVPDIQSSVLPEVADVQKCNTALDVLNKLRGTVGDKVEKALQSVSESHSSPDNNKASKGEVKSSTGSGVLRGICNDLLQKIRARESAKIVEDLTKSPEEKKRCEMLERLPELVRILRNYFITERKAAVFLEDAVRKIADSYHSSLTPEEIKLHLQLMADTFPSWLFMITIRKGLFLKIDKNKDINVLLNTMIKK